jgi:hypothetical protein
MVVWRFVRRSRCGRKLHDTSVLPSVGNSQKSRCQRQRKNRLQQQLQALLRATQTQPATQPRSTTNNPFQAFQDKRLPPSEPRTQISPNYLYAKKKKKKKKKKGREYQEKRPKSNRRCTIVHVRMCVKEISPTSQKAETTKTKDGKAKAKAKQVADTDVLPMHGIYIHDIKPSRWKQRHEEASLSW